MSEVAKFPHTVLKHRFPDVPLHGDFTTIQDGEYEPIDVLVGGTPCQSFSIAGLRRGLADERGNLALEYLRLADRLHPRWLLWENVPGVRSSSDGRDFGSFLGGLGELGYGWAYRSLDAQFFDLAQRRERVFVVGHLGDWRRAAAVLFEPSCLRGNPAPSRQTGERVAPTIAARTRSGGGLGTDFDCDGGLITDPSSHLLVYGGNNPAGEIDIATACNAHGGSGRMDFESETSVTHALRADGFDAGEDGTGRGTPIVPVAFAENSRAELRLEGGDGQTTGSLKTGGGKPGQGYLAIAARQGVRRLTPRECERLMGFEDDWTLIPWRGGLAPDGPRYKAIGNSFPVPVTRWIGARIQRQHAEAWS